MERGCLIGADRVACEMLRPTGEFETLSSRPALIMAFFPHPEAKNILGLPELAPVPVTRPKNDDAGNAQNSPLYRRRP